MQRHPSYSKATPEQREGIDRVLAKMEGECSNIVGVESVTGGAFSRSSSLCTLACSEDGWPTVVPPDMLEEVERMLADPPVHPAAAAPKVPAILVASPAESTAIVPVSAEGRPAFMTAEDDAMLLALEGHRPVHPGAKMQHRIASGLADPRGDTGDEPAQKAARPASKTGDSSKGKKDCIFWPNHRFRCVCACVYVYMFLCVGCLRAHMLTRVYFCM